MFKSIILLIGQNKSGIVPTVLPAGFRKITGIYLEMGAM